MTVEEWLRDSSQKLEKAGISTSKLDAEIILSDILKKNKSWLISHADHKLTKNDQQKADAWRKRREKHEPIAYIRGFKEFYRRNFKVNKNVLVPRPESEALIDLAINCPLKAGDSIIDAGTGSGNLGITLKLELPDTNVTLLDISEDALAVARENARSLKTEVSLVNQDVMKLQRKTELPHAPYSLIVANLPYVDDKWDRSQATDFEPSLALFSPERGLWHYINFLSAVPHFLQKGGWVILEADPRQQDELLHFAEKLGFELNSRSDYALLLTKKVLKVL